MSWQGDDSGLIQAEGASVSCSGAKKANAIFLGEGAAGVSCWEFNIQAGQGLWVGLATEDNFGSGYKLKGLLYGGPGNLSDGGALLKGKWGPKFGPGDKIKMRLDVASDSASVAFAKNNEGLGTAFDIQGWTGGSSLRPVVSFDASGQSVEISSVPAGGEDSFCASLTGGSGIAGSWCQEGEACRLTVEEGGSGEYRVSAKVANTMSCQVRQEGGKMVAGPVMSTQMMPPPHLQEKEGQMNQLLGGLSAMEREGDCLKVTSGDRHELFQRAPAGEPVVKENIKWIQ